MSVNLPTFYAQQYAANIQMLLQIKGSKLRNAVMNGTHTGSKQAAIVDQIGAVEMQAVTGRFNPMGRVDAQTDRRWVTPSDFDLPQLIDTFDLLKMIADPKSAYVQNAVMAAGRKMDDLIIAAFMGTAKTGETGSTSTSFAAGNEIDVAVGGANSRLNVAKIKAVKELMRSQFVDFETEEAYIGLTAKDESSLLNEIQVISSDFAGTRDAPVLQDGKLVRFLGFNFIYCEKIETAAAGTNEVNIPVWVKSGMHLGVWSDMLVDVDRRKDLQGMPWQVYMTLSAGATRIEENKVYNIESYRA